MADYNSKPLWQMVVDGFCYRLFQFTTLHERNQSFGNTAHAP